MGIYRNARMMRKIQAMSAGRLEQDGKNGRTALCGDQGLPQQHIDRFLLKELYVCIRWSGNLEKQEQTGAFFYFSCDLVDWPPHPWRTELYFV